MSEDREKAIEALRNLYRFVNAECAIAARQADDAKSVKDYRANDRHQSYGRAMAKVRGRVMDLARRSFLIDVTVEESSRGEESK